MSLYDVLGDRKTQSVMPEENEGLLVSLSDVPTKTMMYLDALMDERQEYTDYSDLPATSNLSGSVLEKLNAIWKMGGNAQVDYWPEDNDPFVRARWFAEGKGRAYIGYAEAMNVMGDYADDVIIRRFSYGTGKDIPLFYMDVVGISSKICGEKKELAIELANILISEEVLTAMSAPGKDGGSPQYLLTTRRSVYDALCEDYPIYSHLKNIVDRSDNRVLRIGAQARQFITEMEEELSEQIAQAGNA